MSSPEHNLHIGDRVTTHSRLVPGRLEGATFEVDAVTPGKHGVDTIDLLADDGTIVAVSHFTVRPAQDLRLEPGLLGATVYFRGERVGRVDLNGGEWRALDTYRNFVGRAATERAAAELLRP